MRNPDTVHWRDSARTPKLFMLDAYSVFPLLIFLLHIRWYTFFIAIFVCAFFAVLNRFGFTFPVFVRWLRSFLAGPHRMSRPWNYHRWD